MTSIPANGALMFEQATDWFIRMRAVDATADDLAGWLNWIEADPAHRTAFDQVQDTWRIVGALEPPPLPALDEPMDTTLARAVAEPAFDEPAPEEHTRAHPDDFARAVLARQPNAAHHRRRTALRWIGLGLAASLTAVAVLPRTQQYLARGWYAVTHTASQRIATDHAEPRTVLLPDGSRAQLGADTGVQLRFTQQRRLVKAAEGEVFYRVKPDAKRPFVVQAGPVTVTAVGTAFAVRREAGIVSVVVTEGAVNVASEKAKAPLRAAAGQRVRFDQGKLVDKPEPVQEDTAAVWQRGRLRFQDEPLRVVVASLNRYSEKEIVLADPALGELHFTGTVFEDSTHDWVSAAQRLFPVSVQETRESIVITRR